MSFKEILLYNELQNIIHHSISIYSKIDSQLICFSIELFVYLKICFIVQPVSFQIQKSWVNWNKNIQIRVIFWRWSKFLKKNL